MFMTTKVKKIKYFEITLYLFIALVAISIPLLMRFENGREWRFIFNEWLELIPFLFIFLINNFLFAPKLLFKSKYTAYIVSCILLLIIVGSLNNIFLKPNFPRFNSLPKREQLLDHYQENGKHESPSDIEDLDRKFQARHRRTHDGKMPPKNRPVPPHKMYFNFGIFIVGLLIIGFNSGIKFFVRWMKEQEERDEKERHYLSTELAFLKQQISPHFFMNTLNNIHALVDIDSEHAKNAIIKLSKLMRYLLYETNTDRVPLNKEIDFWESYVELMRLRFDETKLSISIEYPDNVAEIYVPSLLFLPLVENVFKHGVKTGEKSFVNIKFKISDNSLILSIKNSNHSKSKKTFDEASGIGLENIRKRLELIYKTNYILLLEPSEDVYEVLLAIPIENESADL